VLDYSDWAGAFCFMFMEGGQVCQMLLGHCSCSEYTPFEDKSDVLKDNCRGINY
jgi:hypothetical protein